MTIAMLILFAVFGYAAAICFEMGFLYIGIMTAIMAVIFLGGMMFSMMQPSKMPPRPPHEWPPAGW